jgi:hypothetical protein
VVVIQLTKPVSADGRSNRPLVVVALDISLLSST